MRSINNDKFIGIHASFALPKQNGEIMKNMFHQIISPVEVPMFDSELKMDDRTIKGPFSEPVSLESKKIISVLTEDDYKYPLIAADPRKEFLVDEIDEKIEVVGKSQLRIFQGRQAPK